MSKLIKVIAFIFVFNLSFSQEKNKKLNNFTTIFISLNDKAIEKYSISKDTTSASFSIYYKKYMSKKERDKAIKEYNKKIENRKTSTDDPSSVFLPDFSVSFIAFLSNPVTKPEKLKSIKDLDYLTIAEFQDHNYVSTPMVYIIHKQKDGTYLRWETIVPEKL
ncbi:hypothetical protein ACFFLS_11150 [Flavobacterium procerum]|uniref:DUF4829 domain-containing protein n=1 Tax=Flavobacterium procerum TaxID=1455569 RepID=A0ABV6BSI1_9FLAO